jgi:hypothetical protein
MNPMWAAVVGAWAATANRSLVVVLRLRWQTCREQVRQRSLATLAARMSAGSCLVETRADGSQLRLSLGHPADTSDAPRE